MADRYALIDNGKVVNIILWDGDTGNYTPPHEAVLDDGTAHIGGTYSNGAFTPPAPVTIVPEAVTPAQGRIALLRAGMLANVKAMVANAGVDSELDIWWDYATVWERTNANVLGFAAQLGLTSAQIDSLFIEAASIV